MSLRCIPSPYIRSKIAYRRIVKRSGSYQSDLVPRLIIVLLNCQADEAYQVGKGLTPVGAYLAQDDIIRIALEHGVDMIHPG